MMMEKSQGATQAGWNEKQIWRGAGRQPIRSDDMSNECKNH